MSPPGRPKGEFRSAQHEGTPATRRAARARPLARTLSRTHPARAARPLARQPALWLALLLSLGGCGQAPDDAPTPTPTPAPADAPTQQRQAPTPGQAAAATALRPQADTPAAAAAGWAVTALLPQGDIDLPDGRVERSYRVVFANGPQEHDTALLRLVAAPPGVERVRADLVLGEVAAQARFSPGGMLLLRHLPTQDLAPGALGWALLPAPLSAASVQGRLLAGPATQPAVAAVAGHQAAADPRPRTLLLAHLRPDAPVAAVNQALRQAGVRIVQMRAGNHGLTLRPLAGDSAAAQRAQPVLAGADVFSGLWLQAAAPVATAATDAAPARQPTDCHD